MNKKSLVIKVITLASFFSFVIGFVLFRMGCFNPQNQEVLAFNPNGTVLNNTNYTSSDSAKLARKNRYVVQKSNRTMYTHYIIVRDAKTHEIIDSVYRNPRKAASSKVMILDTDDLVNFQNAITGKYIFEYLHYDPLVLPENIAESDTITEEMFYIDEMSTSKSGRIFYEEDIKLDTTKFRKMMKYDSLFKQTPKQEK